MARCHQAAVLATESGQVSIGVLVHGGSMPGGCDCLRASTAKSVMWERFLPTNRHGGVGALAPQSAGPGSQRPPLLGL